MLPQTAPVAAPAAPTGISPRHPIDIRAITLEGGMLGDWQQTIRLATIPHIIARLETSGVLNNLRRLVGESDAPFKGPLFTDSDLYKTLEAIGWEAVRTDVSEHLPFVNDSIRLLDAVQSPDGYLDSYFQGPRDGDRFNDLIESHEMYKLGHLIQAAVAWHHAGRDDLLQIALRYVELVHATFGPGGRDDLDGHPEIETALVELSRVTGDDRHRELAKRMIELRGHRTIGEGNFGAAYYLDTVPVRDSREATGHAVRQLYLLAGVTDVQLDDPHAQYAAALDALWSSVHEQKMYVTGGVGSRHRGESFGDPYELPTDRAYSETCAAIANFHWNWRMLLLTGNGKHADEMERGLYNAIAGSAAIDGKSFFYSNPLQLRSGHAHEEDAPSTRLDWYYCSCCPPNLARLLASINGYILTTSDSAIQFQLYAAGTYDLGDGTTARVRTNYPWNGSVTIEVNAPSLRPIELRIPAWADGASLRVDGAEIAATAGSYSSAPVGSRTIEVTIPVQAVVEQAHPWVDAVRGTFSIRRGPVTYCLEAADLPEGIALQDVIVPERPLIQEYGWDEELSAPVLGIEGGMLRGTSRHLYQPSDRSRQLTTALPVIKAIPYFRWANRSPGAMRVWIPTN